MKQMPEESAMCWEDESYWFASLNPEDTGLPVTIMIDQGATIRELGHPLWAYFRNSYDETDNSFLPITVSRSPRVINVYKEQLGVYRIDIQKIMWFIARRFRQLEAIACDKLDIDDFVKFVQADKDSLVESDRDFSLYTTEKDNHIKVDEDDNPVQR